MSNNRSCYERLIIYKWNYFVYRELVFAVKDDGNGILIIHYYWTANPFCENCYVEMQEPGVTIIAVDDDTEGKQIFSIYRSFECSGLPVQDFVHR